VARLVVGVLERDELEGRRLEDADEGGATDVVEARSAPQERHGP
jgi:hypothetical protein